MHMISMSRATATVAIAAALALLLQPQARGDEPFAAELQQSMIWLASAPPGQQVCAVFRKTLDLPGPPERATLRIFADTRYILWINGAYVERGPCRFDPKNPEFDTVDVTNRLAEGLNAVVLLVQHCHDGKEATSPDAYGGRSMRHVPGLAASVEIVLPQGAKRIIGTDESWRASTRTRYKPGFSTWASHLDDIDARLDTGDWTLPAFDDSTWEAAVPVDGAQWGGLRPRAIPLLRETAVEGGSVVERSGEAVQQALSAALPITLTAGEYVIIDAGRFVQAYTVVEMEAQEGSQLSIEYAQAYFTTGRKPVGSWDHVNRYIARDGRQTYMSTDTFGFKYLVIRVESGEVRLDGIQIVNRLYPFDLAGSFSSEDELLNTIWQISADTILTCSEDAYVDCATRERVEWLGDGVAVEYPVTQVAFAGPGADGKPIYADPRLLRNMVRHIGQSQQPDGRVKAHHPSDRWDIHGFIEDYACLWIQGVHTYCLNACIPDGLNDGEEVARELWPAIQAQVAWFMERRTERGLVLARDFVFPGNPLCYRVCEGTTLNAYCCKALLDAADLGRILGDSNRQEEYAGAARALREAINTHLWDERAGTYHGGIENGERLPPTVHAALIALYFDIVPPDRVGRVRQWLLDSHRNEGISPYVHMFFLQVLYDMDTDATDQLVIDLIRERWKAMAEGETGTVWEGFDPGEYCHDMGAAPAYFLSRYVLGVRTQGPLTDRRILIQPRLGDLKRASGVVVTEFGPVSVSWTRSEEGLAFELETPTATRLSLPHMSGEGRLVVDGLHVPIQKEDRYVACDLSSGKHSGTLILRP